MPKNIFSQVAINFFFVDNIEKWKKEIHIVESAENMEKKKTHVYRKRTKSG